MEVVSWKFTIRISKDGLTTGTCESKRSDGEIVRTSFPFTGTDDMKANIEDHTRAVDLFDRATMNRVHSAAVQSIHS